jgi:hypothetical protein
MDKARMPQTKKIASFFFIFNSPFLSPSPCPGGLPGAAAAFRPTPRRFALGDDILS